ncbi:hypothetical protein [Pyruvatibacter sp.]|uniref:hypothetical protein n=1 Tax=Pyruvatibacter sp. TaxID=1981328 RepID=UPI0032666CA1
MRTKLITFLIIAVLGAAGVWQILQTSQPGAIVFGASMLLVGIAVLFARPSKSSGKKPSDKMPPHAVALRQSRAMVRGQDGEIQGLPGGPA